MRASDVHEQSYAPGGFATTQWSLINRATAPSVEGRAALEALCRAYWFPVYAFARKQGCNASDAEDVTQDFFAEIVQSEFLQRADPARGRFRSYLLTALPCFIRAHSRLVSILGRSKIRLNAQMHDRQRRPPFLPPLRRASARIVCR